MSSKHRSFETGQLANTAGPKTDRRDMAAVYTEMRRSLMRFAFRYFKKPQEIEDVVQEAFVKVIEAQQTSARFTIHRPIYIRPLRTWPSNNSTKVSIGSPIQ